MMIKRFSLAPLLALIMATGLFGFSAPANADPPFTVCASGCAFTSIQAAINAALPSGTVKVGPGHYVENLTISNPVTLVGSGNATVVYPAFSSPNPPVCDGGGTFCGDPAAVSNMIMVQANDVTIKNMTLEGDNPTNNSGIVVGGADIDARNGIIENWTLGTFTNLTVSHVTVRDMYLRGIEAVGAIKGETFTFDENTVANVQGSPSSIAVFNSGGSGVISGNKVSGSNDAISANWSFGTQFVNNVVTNSASGIHTDNNGGAGGSADLIRDNTVRDCMKDGYGIWVFATYVSQVVDGNDVKGCYVGLAVFGSQSPGQGPTFSNNVVNGRGATTSDPSGTYGAYVATDLLGYGAADVNTTFTGDSFKNFTTGLFVTQTTFFSGSGGSSHQATVTAHGDIFRNNGVGANGELGTIVNATGSWWGCARGPNTPGCDTALGTVGFTPWLAKPPFGGDDH
jgi:hypothetical protein